MDIRASENWKKIKKKYEVYVVATGVKEKSKKVQAVVLKNLMGDKAVEKLESLEFTEDDDKDDPEVLIQKMDEYLRPLKNTTYERHICFTRKQGMSENIDAYVTALKLKAKDCEFGSLSDILICGVRSDAKRG